jgi:hypothetical protein
VENGVGKPAASEKSAPNAGVGKRAWRTPIPHLSRLDRKVEPGLIVFLGEENFNGELSTTEKVNPTKLKR